MNWIKGITEVWEKKTKGKSKIPVMFTFLYKDPLEAIELISKYDIKNLLIYHAVLHSGKKKVGSIIKSQVSCCDYCDSLFAFDKIDPFPFGCCTSPNQWTKIGSNTPILVHWFPGQHSFYLLDKISQCVSNNCSPFSLNLFQMFFSSFHSSSIISNCFRLLLYFIEAHFSQLNIHVRCILGAHLL